MTLPGEIERRTHLLDRLAAFFRMRPFVWIAADELASIAGALAWRTRVSDLRLKKHMRIEWNKNSRFSCYRYVPHEPLGRDATEPNVLVDSRLRQKDLF